MAYGRKRSRSAAVYSRASKRRRFNPSAHAKARGVVRRFVRRYRKRKSFGAGRLTPTHLGLNQPARVMVKHKNCISTKYTNTNLLFSTTIFVLQPNRLRDIVEASLNGPFPDNFVTMARIFKKYRVHAVKIHLQLDKLDINNSQTQYLVSYTTPALTAGPVSTDPFVVDNVDKVNAFFQERGIRKKYISGNEATSFAGQTRFNVGYFSIKRIQGERHLDPTDFEGEVSSVGAEISAPKHLPRIYIKAVSPNHDGWSATQSNITVRLFITFYTEWYARRREFEGTRTG